jgi:hypothetical protein
LEWIKRLFSKEQSPTFKKPVGTILENRGKKNTERILAGAVPRGVELMGFHFQEKAK